VGACVREQREFFDRLAPDWDALERPDIGPRLERVVREAGISPGMRVLDVGTGPGGDVGYPVRMRFCVRLRHGRAGVLSRPRAQPLLKGAVFLRVEEGSAAAIHRAKFSQSLPKSAGTIPRSGKQSVWTAWIFGRVSSLKVDLPNL
jgi:hypothetical protein